MGADNAVSPNDEVFLCGDYHTAVAKPTILLDDYPAA
jgi:hypothetical protein